MLDDINELIEKLTSYGIRQIEIPKSHPNVTILNWSNGSEEWYTHHSDHTKHLKKGVIISLDANQLAVPYKRVNVLKVIKQLDELPLFKNSFEVRSKISNQSINSMT